MINLIGFDVPKAASPMPNIGADLMAAEAEGYFEGMPTDSNSVMATLELLRHREIDVDQAAMLIGITKARLVTLLMKLPIADFKLVR
jgi:hypothetical protein